MYLNVYLLESSNKAFLCIFVSEYDPDYYSRNAAYYNYYRDRYTRGGYYDDVDNWYYQDRARYVAMGNIFF